MRLNIGCGGQVADGWENLDANPTAPGAGYGDIRMLYLRASHLKYRLIVAHHVLDLLDSWADVREALNAMRAVSAPGGAARISGSDPSAMLNGVLRSDGSFFDGMGLDAYPLGERVQRWWSWRTLCLPAPLVISEALNAGWTRAYRVPFKTTATDYDDVIALDTRRDESYFIELIR